MRSRRRTGSRHGPGTRLSVLWTQAYTGFAKIGERKAEQFRRLSISDHSFKEWSVFDVNSANRETFLAYLCEPGNIDLSPKDATQSRESWTVAASVRRRLSHFRVFRARPEVPRDDIGT